MQMFLDLQLWIEMSGDQIKSPLPSVADSIWDSPFQNTEYAPYVVVALLKSTPKKQIPQFVLEKLKEELIKECEPMLLPPAKPWYKFWSNK